jgi:hypothetical protein
MDERRRSMGWVNRGVAGVGVFINFAAFTNRVRRTPLNNHLRPRQPLQSTPELESVKTTAIGERVLGSGVPVRGVGLHRLESA